uniref:SEA domain-containing protein n=1 Tax=Macrostomum lignano TaxID=282301 RepID=A0A1I8IHQ6_9PLAT
SPILDSTIQPKNEANFKPNLFLPFPSNPLAYLTLVQSISEVQLATGSPVISPTELRVSYLITPSQSNPLCNDFNNGGLLSRKKRAEASSSQFALSLTVALTVTGSNDTIASLVQSIQTVVDNLNLPITAAVVQSNTGTEPWVIAVATVCAVLGAALILVIILVLIKKPNKVGPAPAE